jgi:hypothetical protein
VKSLRYFLPLLLTSSLFAQAPNPRLVLCNASAACSHAYQGGQFVETISDSGYSISLTAHDTGKYLKVDLVVNNDHGSTVDLMPASIWAKQTEPKEKELKAQSVEKMEHSLNRRTAWANGFTGFAGGMARQQSTTDTTSSGTVSAYGSDGSYANGSYQGTSTSTTSAPDYAAQERAREQIAMNRQRAANAEQYLEGVALRANTLAPGQSTRGAVYFQRGPKNGIVQIGIPIGNTLYQFPFVFKK